MSLRLEDHDAPPSPESGPMPLVTVTVTSPKTAAFKSAVLAAVHRALVNSGVPDADRFQRVFELSGEDFRFDPRYPDLASDRGDAFVLIEILWSVGRSVKVRRGVIADIMAGLARDPGLDPEHVMLVFKETAWESWVFGGGRILHA
jgi:phenylpyruvate tautomerase PptA (4-oxalocrotonate tautomerase family)